MHEIAHGYLGTAWNHSSPKVRLTAMTMRHIRGMN
jgi:hypothetical protein